VSFIKWVEDDEATGKTAEVYASWRSRNPGREGMPDILKCFSLRPDVLKSVIRFSDELHFSTGHLDRRVKEMLATYVSGLNACCY
jgi:hypothetical protein